MQWRTLTSAVDAALTDTPAVYLAGARQTGKTTLARALVESGRIERYLTLDDPTVRAAAEADPAAFLAGLPGSAVLDEVQQARSLFPLLRAEIDRDRRPGRLLLTGSAHVLALPRLAEALVGRMEVLTLWSFSQGEIVSRRDGLVDALFDDELPKWKGVAEFRPQLVERALRGGFPELIERDEARRAAWVRSYVDFILRRDARELSNVDGLAALPRLFELCAARSATLLNLAELSRSAGIPRSTLERYFTLLESLFLVARIPGWSSKRAKRLTKAPKLHLTDGAILAQFARLTADELRERPDRAGPLLESFVAMELTKQLGWSRARCRLFHFRTPSGREVDLVLEDERGRLVGIEVKAASSVETRDFRGIETLAEHAGDSFHRGVVLYAGEQAVAFGPRRHALPLPALWELGSTPQPDGPMV